jgi:competence protein ComEA
VPDPSPDAAPVAPAADPPFFRPPPEPPPPWRRILELVDVLRDRLVTDRRTTLAGVASVLVVVTVVLVAVRSTSSAGARPEVSLPPASGASPRTAPVSTTPDVIVVYVTGAVAKSGVYRLPPTARVADALDAAGGADDDADLDRMNLAAPLGDGDRVYVPVQGAGTGDPAAEPTAGESGGQSAAPVNLNSATATELDALPGVGPSLAGAIVEFRRQHGRFVSVEGLLDVPGIGPAKLAALRERVRV